MSGYVHPKEPTPLRFAQLYQARNGTMWQCMELRDIWLWQAGLRDTKQSVTVARMERARTLEPAGLITFSWCPNKIWWRVSDGAVCQADAVEQSFLYSTTSAFEQSFLYSTTSAFEPESLYSRRHPEPTPPPPPSEAERRLAAVEADVRLAKNNNAELNRRINKIAKDVEHATARLVNTSKRLDGRIEAVFQAPHTGFVVRNNRSEPVLPGAVPPGELWHDTMHDTLFVPRSATEHNWFIYSTGRFYIDKSVASHWRVKLREPRPGFHLSELADAEVLPPVDLPVLARIKYKSGKTYLSVLTHDGDCWRRQAGGRLDASWRTAAHFRGIDRVGHVVEWTTVPGLDKI